MMTPHQKLTWQQKTVIRILILIAKIVIVDDELHKELTGLHNHIAAGFGETNA